MIDDVYINRIVEDARDQFGTTHNIEHIYDEKQEPYGYRCRSCRIIFLLQEPKIIMEKECFGWKTNLFKLIKEASGSENANG